MKTKELLLTYLILVHTIASVEAQGTFQNLGFGSASLVAIPGDFFGRVRFDAAFPGWVGYIGGVQQGAALYNSWYLDSSGIGILDSGWNGGGLPAIPPGVISGNYTALLQAGGTGPTATPADTTLSQTSLVPVSAQSLRFRAYGTDSNGPLLVFLGGQRLNLSPLGSGVNYTVYGADIHVWQGLVAQLDFTVVAERPHVVNNNITLDAIYFSDVPIPEPGTICLLGLGALFLGWRLLSKSRS